MVSTATSEERTPSAESSRYPEERGGPKSCDQKYSAVTGAGEPAGLATRRVQEKPGRSDPTVVLR